MPLLLILLLLLFRLINAVGLFEQKIIDSSLLSNSSHPTVVLTSSHFVVAAARSCPTSRSSFPGKSLQSTDSLLVNLSRSLNLSHFISNGFVAAAVDLPENFAESVENLPSSNRTLQTDSNETEVCDTPLAAVFHVFRNGRLFQSASAEKSNLQLPSDDVLLGDELKMINSLIVSATLSQGLNTTHLSSDMSFLLEEQVASVSESVQGISS